MSNVKPEVVAVIPARMESSRYPGKPLELIGGIPMVIHCLKRTQLSKHITSVVVATCNKEIMDAVKRHGGEAIMTKNTHVRCTDRVSEAMSKLDGKADFVVIVQGDEPMVQPEMIDLAVKPLLEDASVKCTNLVAPITSEEEFQSPNTIKLVMNKNNDILFMSREPIPTSRLNPSDKSKRYKQVCIMGFRMETLNKYVELNPTKLEILESIDMNRLLENGIPIRGVMTDFSTFAVDTPDDLKHVEALMAKDPLLKHYK